eukprot:Skav224091  [mRNA]  locus=scaffold942:526972:530749:- [translate_table: standard]
MFALMDRVSAIEGLEPKGEIPQAEKGDAGTIEFVDVKFFYPFRPEIMVLKGINFKITAGPRDVVFVERWTTELLG